MIKISKQANRKALLCIILVFIAVLILGYLDELGIDHTKEVIDTFKTILLLSLPFFGYWAVIKLRNPKDIEDVSLLPGTKDIRISFYKISGFVDRNNQISFVRFFFGQGLIYMYFRNYMKIYEGPFYIKNNEEAEQGMFYIKSISNYENEELTLEIHSKNILNLNYKLLLKNLSKNDYDLIKSHIS